MTNYREILRLYSLGISKLQISKSLQCSRQTVVTVLQKAETYSLRWPLDDSWTNQRISKLFFPSAKAESMYEMPDCERYHRELQKPGVTLSLLWYEYHQECMSRGTIPYKVTQFKKYMHDYAVSQNLTMHLEHKPGDIMQVDWAGDTLPLLDTETGEIRKLYLFVCTLPYSGYAYCEPCLSMDQENWITCNVNALQFFGGVPHIIQCDNLKTGVSRNTHSELILNRSYQDMAEHYNLAILPARVRKPKDKAHVEGTVGILSTWIIAALRNRRFLTEREAADAVAEKLADFNNRPFRKRAGSRAELFQEEKLFLSALPQRAYELSEWHTVVAGLNYHICVDHQYYSVPYEYARQELDTRMTRSMVEMFFEGSRICSHRRLHGAHGQYSTCTEHMPQQHREYLEWNGARFRREACMVGPETERVVEYLLTSVKAERQSYRSCANLLKLREKYTVERLETACKKVLRFTAKPSYKSVLEILRSGLD